MACSSMTRKYEVFVSFQGDTRLNFVDHLFGAFQRKGVVAFRDDTNIKKGESLEPELVRAIEGSLVYVVVFSKNYASSTWCLRELVKILECVQVSGKRVFPVFYDVDPSEVRGQKTGNYAEAFAKHKERFKQDLDMVQKWRTALTQVANLSGWDMRHMPQYAEIEKMVKEIVNILGHKFSSLLKDVVGMHSPIEKLENLLLLESVDDVRVLGISGPSGIGKSTLVTILYGKISHQFEACCFIDDFSKTYRQDGLIGVLQQVLSQILSFLGEEPLKICTPYDIINLIQSRLCRLRALIIIDNVDQELEKLIVDRECLGAGSRMIITSRDEHIFKEIGVDFVYKVPLMNRANSLLLFCRKAFKSNYIRSDYEQLTNRILNYVVGLPLAIKVLGSFLSGQDIFGWNSALARLRESSNNDIMDVMRLCFDGLEEMEKEIFLDIACFFVGMGEKAVKHILNCCGFHPYIGLKVLIDRSLITSVANDECSERTVRMHDLLQELGKQIVQENSKTNPRKWSRLWQHKNLDTVVWTNMEKNVEALVLSHRLCNIEGEISVGKALSNMTHLRLLIIYNVDLLGNLDCLSDELRYVHLYEYPFQYLPSSFHPNQLVDLHLPSSRIRQLWKGKKYLPNLKNMDLSYSKNLIMIPDFREFPNIERLNLEGCEKLVQLGPSNDVPRKLVFLNVNDCKRLSRIPEEIFCLVCFRDLNISGCSQAFNFKSMIMAPFLSLCQLDVSFCNLGKLPGAIGCLHLLERLNLGGNRFATLPSLEKLSKLVYLNLEHCKYLKSLTALPSPATTMRDLVFSKDKYRRRGMYIFNCPNLDEKEHWSNMASSWMIQFIRANQQSSELFRYVDTIIPGNEIPRWFKNQRLGSSRIWMHPPPIMGDNDVIGVVYCAVFPMVPNNKTGFLELKISFGQTNDGNCSFNINSPVILESDRITVKSTHMWLIYFPLESFLNSLRLRGMSPRNLDRLVIDANRDMTLSFVEVVKHGYNWVFKKDLQIVHDGNSLAQTHNFLAI